MRFKNPSSLAEENILIQGAREHNLKNIDLVIPLNRMVVVTGVSGSGKSTLAFDLLFAEGQRRFLDCMSAYARQFVEQLSRPDADRITGIPPTVSIEQRISRGGGKSTVATVTEVHHFLRLLFARTGTQFCPDCLLPVQPQTLDQLLGGLREGLKSRGPLKLLAPVVRNRKGFHTEVSQWAARHGFREVRADGRIYPTDKPLRLDRYREHDVEIVVGELQSSDWTGGLSASQPLIEKTLQLGKGVLFALDHSQHLTVHSTLRACPRCRCSFAPLDPKNFSYNSVQGWCPECRGFGELFYLPEVERGARAGSIEESWFEWQEGKREICPGCQGSRLNKMARAVRLRPELFQDATGQAGSLAGKQGPTIDTFAAAPVSQALELMNSFKLEGRLKAVARDILPEITSRLQFLCEIGLDYLQLGRSATTLSGGEAQRIRLAAQLGSNLSGVLYVLDEPTIGLHARDNQQLLQTLSRLKSQGNSLLVVEHDEETMRQADYIIDLGPGAGVNGGEVVAAGTLPEILDHQHSITGHWLRLPRTFPSRGKRRPIQQSRENGRKRTAHHSGPTVSIHTPFLELVNATANNLKKLTVRFPLQRFVVVTGVSGSGKSTLVRRCLLERLKECLQRKKPPEDLRGWEPIKAVYEVDQSPIGRTPRSIPATYVGFFDHIRSLFAQIPEARLRGYSAGRFSFNSPQGRCPGCQGAGNIKLEMSFMPAAYTRCEACAGTRYLPETLEIELRGKTIAQVLDMDMGEALEFFQAFPKVRQPLEALRDTGLDYLKLGQISPTLSGGEAQRMKLVTHLLSGLKGTRDLFSQDKPHNLFILEEPTIGLHMADVHRLVQVLQRLVDAGHSVIVIEHNLELIAEADWVIDLGPEGGDRGGKVVAGGTPEEIAACPGSHTGRFLRRVLK